MAGGGAIKAIAVGASCVMLAACLILPHWYESGDNAGLVDAIRHVSQDLGHWAIPLFVLLHTLAIALCFPYAVLFEAAASFLFGFVWGVGCIFAAKVLGASTAFWLGRLLFRNSKMLSDMVRGNKYFKLLNEGVARDGWKFVLLARFSPVPSYVINYGLAATDIRFFADFLLPTVCGGLPMIVQNASIGSLTSAATQARSGDTRNAAPPLMSYFFPALGLSTGVLLTWRIKRYASAGAATVLDTTPQQQQQEANLDDQQQDSSKPRNRR